MERVVVRTVLFGLIVFQLFLANVSASAQDADLFWLSTASDCRSFNRGLATYYHRAGSISKPTEKQKEEIEKIIKAACSPRFANCDFGICEKRSTLQRPSDYSRIASANANEPFVTDPLAWLSHPLKCSEFIEQMKVRYAPLGKFSELPQSKKTEILRVLDMACSERFAHCGFKNCSTDSDTSAQIAKDQEENSEAVQPPVDSASAEESPPEVEGIATEEKELLFKKYLAELQEEQKQFIAEKVAEEKEQGLVWVRFTVPVDGEIRKRKPKPEKEEKKVLYPGYEGNRDGEYADSAEESSPGDYPSPSREPDEVEEGEEVEGADGTEEEKELDSADFEKPPAQPSNIKVEGFRRN